MESSEGEDFLYSDDVNEEYSGYEEEGDGEEFKDEMRDSEDESEDDLSESEDKPKYSEELEYEDIGEPATFNFNIHNGKRKVYLFLLTRSFS